MIENLGNVGDFIGGIGVVITLIYLATQIAQNTRSLRLSNLQQTMGTSVSLNQTTMLAQHWQVFHQHENGMIETKVFNAYMIRLQLTLRPPLSRAMWRFRMKSTFPLDFQACVEKYIEDVE